MKLIIALCLVTLAMASGALKEHKKKAYKAGYAAAKMEESELWGWHSFMLYHLAESHVAHAPKHNDTHAVKHYNGVKAALGPHEETLRNSFHAGYAAVKMEESELWGWHSFTHAISHVAHEAEHDVSHAVKDAASAVKSMVMAHKC
jgi:hypothetical protein